MGTNFVENNHNLSDEEIIALINKGNYDFLQVIIQRYYPVVLYYVRKYCPTDYFEDAVQEGNLALYQAVKEFDSEKASFSTLASVCIKRAMISVIRSRQRKKEIPEELVSAIELEDIVDESNPEILFIEREGLEELKSNIKLELSSLEYKVLQLYLSGEDYLSISELLGISQKSVDNALSRIRKKLKK